MAKFAEKYLKRERNPSLCVIDDLDRKLDLVAVHIDEGNLSSGERIFQREHRQQADAEQTGNGVDDIGSMTDLHGAFQVKTGGGKIVFEYLAVIAALFRENKALLQQTFQGNVLLACQRMASGTEKGNIRRKGTCGLPVGTNDRFVQQENHLCRDLPWPSEL